MVISSSTLLKAATRYPVSDQLAVLMAYRHGLRASELVLMQWKHFVLHAARVRVERVKRGISGINHDLSGEEFRLIRRHRRTQAPGTRYVFSSERGGPWAAVSFSRVVERQGQKALLDVESMPTCFGIAADHTLQPRASTQEGSRLEWVKRTL
jgi:integrase